MVLRAFFIFILFPRIASATTASAGIASAKHTIVQALNRSGIIVSYVLYINQALRHKHQRGERKINEWHFYCYGQGLKYVENSFIYKSNYLVNHMHSPFNNTFFFVRFFHLDPKSGGTEKGMTVPKHYITINKL